MRESNLETMLKLGQVWADVEKNLEANLLVFLEKLFFLEPSAVLPLRSLERRRAAHKNEGTVQPEGVQEPSLSLRIKIVALHFGRALHAVLPPPATDSNAPAAPMSTAEASTDAWQQLAPGFRSLARSFADHGWGCAYSCPSFSTCSKSLNVQIRIHNETLCWFNQVLVES